MKLLIVFCMLLPYFQNMVVNGGATNYHWRDFYGALLTFKDNFVAGEEPSDTIYIGQGYCENVGVLYGRLTTRNYFQSPCQGPAFPYAPKILCTDQEYNLRWLATSSQTYQTDTLGKDPVQGGFFVANSSVAHIGKIHTANGFMIGSIRVRDAVPTLTYVDPVTKEFLTTTGVFDVLIYKAS